MKKTLYTLFLIAYATVVLSSCQKEEAYGYLKIGMDTLVSTVETKVSDVPVGYTPEKLHVDILDSQNNPVKSTDDFDNDSEFKEKLKLAPGTYTIVAHSAGWDGSQSAFDAPYYYGSTTATVELKKVKDASIVCTLANVKVSVNFDEAFKKYFKSAKATVNSVLASVNPLVFAMSDATPKVGYFPAGNLALKIEVENQKSESFSQENTISDVQPRQYIKINYRFEKEHTSGITVKYDDEECAYNWTIPIIMSEEEDNPPAQQGINLSCSNPSYIWGHYVTLATTVGEGEFEQDKVVLLWREKGTEYWNTIANSELSYDSASRTYSISKFKGLAADKNYEYKAVYNETSSSNTISFKTEKEEGIYNAGMEYWSSNNANQSGVSYWSSSNTKFMGVAVTVTTQDTGFYHSGTSSAKLACASKAGKFAAASLFTGKFIELIGTNGAKLDWGVPFTSRPTKLTGYMNYTSGTITTNPPSGVSGVPAKGENDICQIMCVLLHTTPQNNNYTDPNTRDGGPLHVGGNASSGIYEKSTEIDWENDPRIVAYGRLLKNESSTQGEFEKFSIDLEYHDLTTIPNYMMIVCSASQFGDYFHGSTSSVLYLDDFEFEYGDTPKVQNR